MGILTTDELREHVSTSLSDDALGRVLAANEAELNEWAGEFVPDGSGGPETITETVFRPGTRLLPLRQPVRFDDDGEPMIESVREHAWGDDEGSAVPSSDYVVRGSDLDRGPYYWPYRTVVVYTPADRLAIRQMALVELCRISISFDPALASKSIGDWSESYRATGDEGSLRDAQLRRVYDPRPFA